jgi:prepilin-type N-terminal cleavage/methylation domain-containing protein
MIRTRNSEVQPGFEGAAFTLIEIVVALTIAAVVAAIAIPMVKGLARAEAVRAPLKMLGEAVQEARQRAMREHRSYQIVFEHDGIHASPAMYPYEKREEFLKHLEEMRTPPRVDVIERTVVQRTEVKREEPINGRTHEKEDAEPQDEPPRFVPPWTVSIPLPTESECEVLMWGDGEWDVIEGEKVRRWVIQPTGMVNPTRVLLRTHEAELEAGFDLLTGELTGERTRLAALKP